VRALQSAGLHTLGDVADAFPHVLENLPELGKARMRQIGDVLIVEGLR
jgi:hypothetical protein